jgi:Secretion system C-terminal sorting domain
VVGGSPNGEEGLILHTTNGGATFIEEEEIYEVPTEFLLAQNYPNPFNPSTKIIYSILSVTLRQAQSDILVTLKIFDVLGNEIETLVNEEKTVGTYEVTWYAEGLPSGVYFYQLKAGSFIESKKMILMK